MRRLLLTLVIICLFINCLTVCAEQNIMLVLNGEKVNCDVPPRIVNDRTLIPVRALFEDMGAKVSWDESKKSVTINYDNTEIILKADSKVAYVNGNTKILDVAATIINSRTMIPVRFIAESFGCEVNWDEKTKTVSVTADVKNSTITTKFTINAAYVTEEDEQTVIKIMGAGEANVSYMELSNLKRLVFDFKDTKLDVETPSIVCDDDFLTSVRFGQFDSTTTRVVLDMKENVKYKLIHNANKENYVIKLQSDKYVPNTDEKIVFIDAGHGGSEVGTIGTLYASTDVSSLLPPLGNTQKDITAYEKDTNLKISLKVEKLLKNAGIRTVMVRTTDTYINIYDRPKIANEENAYLYLSIHNNASTSNSVSGTQVYYSDSTPSFSNMTNKEVANIYYDEITNTTGLRRAGVVDNSRYIVINQTNMPAFILEVGFFSNQEDLKKLLDDKFLDKVAQGICNATVKVLEKAEY